MVDDSFIFYAIKEFIFWCSPIIFFVGVLLVLYGNYRKLETNLAREIGGICKKTFIKWETNIYTFHDWVMERHTLVGLILVVCALLFFFNLR